MWQINRWDVMGAGGAAIWALYSGLWRLAQQRWGKLRRCFNPPPSLSHSGTIPSQGKGRGLAGQCRCYRIDRYLHDHQSPIG